MLHSSSPLPLTSGRANLPIKFGFTMGTFIAVSLGNTEGVNGKIKGDKTICEFKYYHDKI
jgi:hypothetical protein